MRRTAEEGSPRVLALYLGQNQLQRLDAHLDHGIVRLKGGEILEPQSGGGEQLCDRPVVPPRPAVELIADPHDDGQHQQVGHKPPQGVVDRPDPKHNGRD